MYAIIENQNEIEIKIDGIHIIEKQAGLIRDDITLNSHVYDTEEQTHELVGELTHKLFSFLKNKYNDETARDMIKLLIEEQAEETLGEEIKWTV